MLVLGTSAAVILFGVLGLWLMDRSTEGDDARQIPDAPRFKEPAASRFASPSKDESVSKVREALLIRDSSKVTQYFRTGPTKPTSVITFLEGMAKLDGPIIGFDWYGSLDHNGLLTEAVAIRTLNGNVPKVRLALLTPDDAGNWQIDFDALARTVRPSWNDLLDPKSAGGVVRVMIKRDSYFNRAFSNDSVWSCYEAISPDTEVQLMCYSKRNSPQDQAIQRILASDETITGTSLPVRVTLELRRVEDSDARQFEISGVLAEDWILSSAPFDERFK